MFVAEALARRIALAIDNAYLLSESQAANRAKDEFLATLSHELRTPLNAILGWSQLLNNGNLEKEAATHALQTIERNARMQAQLVEDLLDLSRITMGQMHIESEVVDLTQVVENAIDTVRPAASARNVALEYSQVAITLNSALMAIRDVCNKSHGICFPTPSNLRPKADRFEWLCTARATR
jgi:signal transduction histidine kinase